MVEKFIEKRSEIYLIKNGSAWNWSCGAWVTEVWI